MATQMLQILISNKNCSTIFSITIFQLKEILLVKIKSNSLSLKLLYAYEILLGQDWRVKFNLKWGQRNFSFYCFDWSNFNLLIFNLNLQCVVWFRPYTTIIKMPMCKVQCLIYAISIKIEQKFSAVQ